MKMVNAMLAVMLCAGLVASLGLTACGGDDDEAPQFTCEQALLQFNSQVCQDQADAAVGALKTCAVACPTTECVDECLSSFMNSIPACQPGAFMMFNTCNNTCWEDICGEDFGECLLTQSSGQDCLDDIVTCVNDCP